MHVLNFEIRGQAVRREKERRLAHRRSRAYLAIGASAVLVAWAGNWGSGSVASLRIEPQVANFGVHTIGAIPAVQVFTLRNGSAIPAALGKFRISDTHAEAFLPQSLTCAGPTLADSCQVAVSFNPLHAGLQQARLELVDDKGAVVLSASLIGTGNPPKQEPPPEIVTEAPPKLEISEDRTFATVFVGSATVLSLQLRNSGAGTLSITDVHFEQNGPIQLGVEFQPLSLSAGETGQASLLFRPDTAGKFENTLLITTNVSPDPVRLVFTGVANPAPIPTSRLTINPTRFPSDNSIAIVTLQNTGEGILKPDPPVLQGSSPEMFQIQNNGCLGASLPSTAACQIRVEFLDFSKLHPGIENFNPLQATLTVPDNSNERSSSVALVGGPDPYSKSNAAKAKALAPTANPKLLEMLKRRPK